MRRLSPGLENVLADIYWLRTVQYFGGQRAFAEEQEVRPAGAADRHHDDARPALRDRLPVRRGLPGRAAARGRRAAPGRRRAAAARRPRELPDPGAYARTWASSTSSSSAIRSEAARILAGGGRAAGRARLAADARPPTSCGRRRARDVAPRLAAPLRAVRGPMRDNAAFNLRRLDALDAQDAHQAAVEEFRRRFGRRPGRARGAAQRRAASRAAARSRGRAVRLRPGSGHGCRSQGVVLLEGRR